MKENIYGKYAFLTYQKHHNKLIYNTLNKQPPKLAEIDKSALFVEDPLPDRSLKLPL